MCGIGGILFSTEAGDALENKISNINRIQKHRGPDGQTAWIQGRNGLCHQRLSILDSEGGKQPFWDSTGRYVMVYNGELYNYIELRSSLSPYYNFLTKSDTEVVLAAFIIWGRACLHRFIGMFSFLIWDTKTETAYAARDPLGVKPFVYSCMGSTFLFASELKTLHQILEQPPEIDPYKIAEYVIAPYFSGGGDETLFKQIKYLEPGTEMHISKDGIKLQKYYSFNFKQSAINEEELIQATSEALNHSVRLTLRADAPLGIFLSGGLDSSLIAAIAAKHASAPLSSFTISFDNHSDIHFDSSTIVNSDDLPYAKRLAEQLGFPFKQVSASHFPTLKESLVNLASINDRIPAWEQEFSQHFLSQASAKNFKAVMVGDAADETSYGYFFLLNEPTNRSPLEAINFFGGQKRLKLLSTELQKQIQPLQYFNEHYSQIAKQAGFDFNKAGEERILAMATLIHKRWLERLLHNGDIHTMHFGLEARVPFANQNFLETACLVQPNNGFKNNTEKHILRRAASKWLTSDFTNRKKSALPRDPRLGKRYQLILSQLLHDNNDFIDTFLHRPSLTALCETETITESDRMILFNMISLINWSNHYAK